MSELARAMGAGLRAQANPADAPAMSAYMEGVQPFLGIKTPARSAVVWAALEAVPDKAQRWAAALDLWAGDFREERDAAQDILAASRLTLNDIPQLETMLGGADH